MRQLTIILTLAALTFVGRTAWAGDCGCEVECPRCNHVCKLTTEKETEKKHCWKVKCEPICIPGIRFPWEKCCKPKCAKLKYVNVLEKREYECERCKYKFEPVCTGGCGGACGCAGSTCDAHWTKPNTMESAPSNGDAAPAPPSLDVKFNYGDRPVAPVQLPDPNLSSLFRFPERWVGFSKIIEPRAEK